MRQNDRAREPSYQALLGTCLPNQRNVALVRDGAKMSKLGAKNAHQRYEIPLDFSVHDFVQRAVAEARLVISDIDKAQAEMDLPKSA